MLTEQPGAARIEVGSTVVRLALLYVAQDCGLSVCAHDLPRCSCLLVTDRLTSDGAPVDVFVVRDDPAACQDAVDAALAARARSIVLWSAPDGLQPACDGIRKGLTVIPNRVIELGALAPKLTPRQRETLRLLARGGSSTSIASALRQSESTAKRDIAELLTLFDAPNRAALVSSAASLGFVAAPLRPFPHEVDRAS